MAEGSGAVRCWCVLAAQNQQQATPSGLGQPQVVRSLNQPAVAPANVAPGAGIMKIPEAAVTWIGCR